MAPRRGADDMYNRSDISSGKYSITFIETTANEIAQKGDAQVYLFASWCPYSLAHLMQLKKDEISGISFVSSNYDLKSMARLFKNNLDTIYILSNLHYGQVEGRKIKQFASELLGEESGLTGVPQQFIIQGNKYLRSDIGN
jgi:hypothetical protein